jgi:alpha-tubulin suppressor-like RCC1 family protein
LFGHYVLRTDAKLLYEEDPPSTAQTAVLDADTGLPLEDVQAVFDGPAHGCALLGAAKTVKCWRTAANGNNGGQLGNGTVDSSGPVFRATTVLTAAAQPLTNLTVLADGTSSSGDTRQGDTSNTCAATADGKLYCWGALSFLANGGSALQSAYATLITTDGVTPFANVLQVSVNNTWACALVQGATSKEVWCWGSNAVGNLGTGDTTLKRYPTKVLGFTSPARVLAFGYAGNTFYNNGTACVLEASGNVRCWGSNNCGQVGDGTTNSPVLAPKIVTLMGGTTALPNIVDIRGGGRVPNGGYQDICAIASNHTMQCWGSPFQAYPTTYSTTNIVAVGSLDDSMFRFLTGDGLYHIAPNNGSAMTNRAPNCGLLQ